MLDFEDIDAFADETAESESIASTDDAEVAATPDQSDSQPVADAGKPDADDKTDDSAEKPQPTSDAKAEDQSPAADDKTPEQLLAEVEREIANDKHPKYYRNALKVYKSHFETQTAPYVSLKEHGEPDQIAQKLELVSKLDSIETDPETGIPARTVKPFVEAIVENRGPETAIALMQELGRVPSPQNEGWSLVHELLNACGIDPTRIDDHREFAKNGYASFPKGDSGTGPVPPDPDDLALIPEHLREAFISMTPQEREDVLEQKPALMELALEAVQNKLDAKRTEAQAAADADRQKAEKQAAEQREFAEAVTTRTVELVEESGSNLFKDFTDSLVKNDIDPFDATLTANMVTSALHASGVEGKQVRQALESIGVKLDASLESTFFEWQTAAQQAAYFERAGDKAGHAAAFNRFKELESRLSVKTRPIIAAVVAHRANIAAGRASSVNKRLDSVARQNNGLSATAGRTAAFSNGAGTPKSFEDMTEAEAFV